MSLTSIKRSGSFTSKRNIYKESIRTSITVKKKTFNILPIMLMIHYYSLLYGKPKTTLLTSEVIYLTSFCKSIYKASKRNNIVIYSTLAYITMRKSKSSQNGTREIIRLPSPVLEAKGKSIKI